LQIHCGEEVAIQLGWREPCIGTCSLIAKLRRGTRIAIRLEQRGRREVAKDVPTPGSGKRGRAFCECWTGVTGCAIVLGRNSIDQHLWHDQMVGPLWRVLDGYS
jgi:hypothetical protein